MIQLNISEIQIKNRKRPADPAKVADLAASMYEIGQLQPVGVSKAGALVYGFHRYMAARKLEWQEISAVILDGDKLQLELAEIDENLKRNELNVLQQSQQLSRRDAIMDQLGKRAQSGDNQHNKGGGEMVAPPRTTKDMAREMGLSERSAQQRKQIARDIDPDVQKDIEDTDLADSTTQLLDLAKLSPEKQREAVDLIRSGAAKNMREASRKMTRKELGAAPLPNGTFNLLQADPPWQHENQSWDHSAENHYPTMSIEEIKNMDVSEISADRAVLFLWANGPMLQEALDVIKCWGFTYKASIIWDKARVGPGHYTMTEHEELMIAERGANQESEIDIHQRLLIATKGNHISPEWRPRSIVQAPSREHSSKPELFSEIMEMMYPDLTERVELFARSQRPGWVVHGNQSEGIKA